MDIYQKVLAARGAAFDHPQHDKELMEMVDIKIRQQVPQMIKDEIKQVIVDLRTTLNGKYVDNSNIKQAIIEEILNNL